MTEVAGYVRVSTEKQRENDSHARQRERLEDWAESRGHEIDIFQDIAISGQSDARESYNQLMGEPESDELAEITEYDVLVVREMSRFGRSLKRVTEDIERLNEADVDFVSLKEEIDMTTAQGKLMLHIIAAFNQFWSDWARERAMEYVEKQREEGGPLGRPTKLNDEQMTEVLDWRKKGLSYSHIATLVEEVHDVDVSRQTIYRYCQDAGIDTEEATADD